MCSPRIALCLFVAFVSSILSECNGQGYKPAPTCARLECPSYSVVQSEKEFEIRNYNDALWVSSPKIESNTYREGANKGFRIIRDYYRGNNSQQVKINMTAPVLVDVKGSTYAVHFYVPQKYQKSIPAPNSDEIKAVKIPKYKYAAVRRFDGFITNESIPIQVAALKKSLQGTPYQRAAAIDVYTVAGYNSPFNPVNRVNEIVIWFD
ncbi:hypothetical protein BUALT_Bualt16G0045500 [Buddleja alternifolia]|uniref:Heme-binding protein 2 n=1 Tax=Buddleja alternifolia TaxID=168488 RepID=A0AAV6WFC0_9LAMI|nr:hypothetical protein BUALT_Bualt16G0045500 [Buddleja alternifolia]